MRNFFVLAQALDYIEANLENPVSQECIAAHCYCSLSSLQKLFRYALNMGVKEYQERRRLTQASQVLLGVDAKITDVALRYQYQSPEVFTRAFRRLWGMTPTAFRRTRRFSGLFPRVVGVEQGGNGIMHRKTDITELYDALKEKAGTYVLCFDIVGLLGINEIDRAAGDMAISESFARIDAAASGDMLVFRIGGDEFAMVTGYSDEKEVENAAGQVLMKNGEPIVFGGIEIPISMRAGAMKIHTGNLRYAELYDALAGSVRGCGGDGRVHFAIEA